MHLFVTDSTVGWGAEMSLTSIANQLARQGERVGVVAAPSADWANRLDPVVEVVEHHWLSQPALAGGSFATATFTTRAHQTATTAIGAARLAKCVRSIQPSTLISFSTWRAAEVALAARLCCAPSLFDFHDTFGARSARRAVRLVGSMHTNTVTPSDFLRLSYHMPRAITVPRPVGLVSAKPTLSRQRVFDFAIVGQIAEHKGVHEVVSSFRQAFPDNQAGSLLIVGMPEDDLDSYQRFVQDASFTDTRIVVQTASAAVSDFLQASRHIINYSHHEAFGRTVVEGAVFGCIPIVASGSGPAEVVRDLGQGHVVHNGDLPATLRSARNSWTSDQSEIVSQIAWNLYSDEVVGVRYGLLLDSIGRHKRVRWGH